MLPVCFQMICQKLCQLFEFLTKYLKLLCWHIGNEAQTRLRCRTCRRCHGRGTATQKQREKWWGLGSQKVVVYMCLRCKYDREVVLFVNDFTALWTTSLFMNYTAKENLGLSIFIYIQYTFRSTSTVFQFWSERVRKAFLRDNRGSSVISIQLHSSPDSQLEFDMNHLYPEGPSEFKFLGSDPEACPFSAFVISSCTMEI